MSTQGKETGIALHSDHEGLASCQKNILPREPMPFCSLFGSLGFIYLPSTAFYTRDIRTF